MDRLFDESYWSPLAFSERRHEGQLYVPRVDISESEQEIKVRADIPGVDPEQVNVEVTEDAVLISGSTERSSEEQGDSYYRMERSTGRFSRDITLPCKIDPESVEAKTKNGVISVTLKKLPSERKKKVQVLPE